MNIPGTGINCAFCMANSTMNAQQPMPYNMIANTRAFVLCAFATLRLCVLDLTRSRKGARDAKGGVKLWLHIQLTLMQKSSVCGGAKYNRKEVKQLKIYQVLFATIGIMVCLLGMLPAASAEEPTIIIANASADPGLTTTVKIRCHDVEHLAAFTITLEYNPDVVMVVDEATNPDMGADASVVANNKNGTVILSAFGMDTDVTSADVLLATVTLRAEGNPGEESVLNITTNALVNTANDQIQPRTDIDGAFVVAGSVAPKPFLVSGFVFYGNGSECNGSVVSISNQSDVQWQAATDDGCNYYMLMLTAGTDIDCCETMRFSAIHVDGSASAEYTVTPEDIRNGGSSLFNITIGMLPGDLNGDCEITSEDALLTLQMAVEGEYSQIADVNGDDQITSLDALMILHEAANQ